MVNVTVDFINLISNAEVKAKVLEIFKEYIDAIIDDKINKLAGDIVNIRAVLNANYCVSQTKFSTIDSTLEQVRQEGKNCRQNLLHQCLICLLISV